MVYDFAVLFEYPVAAAAALLQHQDKLASPLGKCLRDEL